MADKCPRVFIRLLLTSRSHDGWGDFYRLARSHVAGFAAIYDVGVGDVDLLNLRIPFSRFLAQSVNLRRREIDHVIGYVLRSLPAGFCDWLEHIPQSGAQLCALVFECVI